jgi:hypothetical protein
LFDGGGLPGSHLGMFLLLLFHHPTSSQLSSEFLSYDCVAGGWNPFFFGLQAMYVEACCDNCNWKSGLWLQ